MQHPVFRYTPAGMHPYLSLMRLDRPIGTWLLLLPAWWAITLEAGGIAQMTGTHLYLLGLFALGAVLMRGAGCVVNDIWDRDFDRAVERTKTRPLASGAVTLKQAILFLVGLLVCGLIILLQLPPVAIGLGVVSLLPVVIYPLAKRVTWYPQAVLGLTFNFGALIGTAAVHDHLTVSAFLLYGAGFFWTLGYDTIYAHQDVADDSLIGVKSTALKFGINSPRYIIGFYILTALGLFAAGLASNAGNLFYILWALACGHMIGQLRTWAMDDPASCLRIFRSNRNYGLIIWAATLFGFLW